MAKPKKDTRGTAEKAKTGQPRMKAPDIIDVLVQMGSSGEQARTILETLCVSCEDEEVEVEAEAEGLEHLELARIQDVIDDLQDGQEDLESLLEQIQRELAALRSDVTALKGQVGSLIMASRPWRVHR